MPYVFSSPIFFVQYITWDGILEHQFSQKSQVFAPCYSQSLILADFKENNNNPYKKIRETRKLRVENQTKLESWLKLLLKNSISGLLVGISTGWCGRRSWWPSTGTPPSGSSPLSGTAWTSSPRYESRTKLNWQVKFVDLSWNSWTKGSSLLLHAIHSIFYWRVLQKTMLYSSFKIPYKKICEWHFVEQKKEVLKPDNNLSMRRRKYMPRNLE